MFQTERSRADVSREDALILVCARLSLTSDQRLALGSILRDRELSWQEVLKKARWHRLTGFLYHHLRDPQFADAVPSWVRDKLEKTYFRNGLRNRLFQVELNRVLGVLQDAEVPIIALKGSALLDRVYQDPSVRPMADIDLLVPEDRAEAAQSGVVGLGYAPVASLEEQEKTRAVHRHLPKLVGPQGRIKFEIHTHIVSRDSPLRFDLSSFWQQAQAATVAGRQVQILAPHHLLIHLSIHFFLDRRFRSAQAIGQICDIAEVIGHYTDSLDWAALSEEVLAHGLSGPVHCSLSLAQELLGAPVPPEFLKRVRPAAYDTSPARLFLRRRVLSNQRVIASQWVSPEKDYSWSNVMRGVWGRLFPGRSYLTKDYREGQADPGAVGSYLTRLSDGGSVLKQYLFSPLDVWREIQVDRWIHSLSVGERPSTNAGGK